MLQKLGNINQSYNNIKNIKTKCSEAHPASKLVS